MHWIPLALLTALSVALRDVSVKTYEELEVEEIAGIEMFWSLPFLVVGLLVIPVPPLSLDFLWAFLLSLPLQTAAYLMYLQAIKASPISLSVPFLSFTPVYMILTGFLVLGEKINFWGTGGIFLVAAGGYVLNADRIQDGLLTPFAALFRERGARLMMGVAFLYSVAGVIGKKGILHSSPLFFMWSFFLVFHLLLLGWFIFRNKISVSFLVAQRKKGVWLGSLLAVHLSTHGLAIAMATAVYMIAVKRSSILFSVLLSWFFLREEKMLYRIPGTMLMFCGVLLISLFG